MKKEYDVIILGGGAAGLTAGIYISRAKMQAAIIDSGTIGGQIILSHQVANYPGVETIFGYQLAKNMKKQAKEFGCDILGNREISRIRLDRDNKEIEVDGTLYSGKAAILAVGGVPRSLGLSSEEHFKGKGISYCATCDGDFYRDQDIVVVGGGNSALEEAVSLTQYARTVTVVHQFDHFQAYKYAVEEAKKNDKISFIMESEIADFQGNGSLEKVLIRSKKDDSIRELAATGTFIFIGYVPNTRSLEGMVKLNDYGEIITDENMATEIPGVYAAGDARAKKYRQITTAVADGTIAALEAIEFARSHSH